jgi:hypothetical protein
MTWEGSVYLMASRFELIKSPLQMVGFYLAWIETAMAASLWPLKDNDTLLTILLSVVVGIASIFALTMVFILIYLVIKDPHWLFNPSDYDPSVQDELFDHDHSVSEALIETAVLKSS